MALPHPSYSDGIGAVLRGRVWLGDQTDYVDVLLRVDDDDPSQPDTLDLRFAHEETGEVILNVPRADLVRALDVLGNERKRVRIAQSDLERTRDA